MNTEQASTDTRARSLSPLTGLAAAVALACAAVVAALVRWSQWWPHSDLRQIWANGMIVLSGLVGVAALAFAVSRASGRRQLLLLGLVAAAAVVGLLGGFELLRSATADVR